MSNHSLKILLVEDDTFLIRMYTEKFEQSNYKVITADNGGEAISQAKSEKPDIILLDIILPKINGFEVLKQLKSDSTTEEIPIVLLTNISQRDGVEQGLSLGADDYLIKAHFTPQEVIEKIKAVLNKRAEGK